jgi:hypothetical protein
VREMGSQEGLYSLLREQAEAVERLHLIDKRIEKIKGILKEFRNKKKKNK